MTAFARILSAWLVAASAAAAHEAPSGWTYPWRCCSGMDCAPVGPNAIACTPEGCTVTLEPGEHPANPDGTAPLVLRTTKQPEPSPDGQNHACINLRTNEVLCLFVGGGV